MTLRPGENNMINVVIGMFCMVVFCLGLMDLVMIYVIISYINVQLDNPKRV